MTSADQPIAEPAESSPSVVDANEDAGTGPTAHLLAFDELPAAPERRKGKPVLTGNPLHQLKAQLQISVGEITLSVGELLAAHEHQVFVLDRGVDQPVDVLLDGRVIARGELVAVDDQFAVRFTELPIPLGN